MLFYLHFVIGVALFLGKKLPTKRDEVDSFADRYGEYLTAIAVFLGALTYGIGWPVFMLTKQIRDGRWF